MNSLRKQSPEAFGAVQNRVKEMIRMSMFGRDATKSSGSLLDSKTIDKFLGETQGERLASIMGPSYVADLLRLRNGLKLMERTGKASPLPMETTVLAGLRVAFGPLAREQRFFTFLRRIGIVRSEKRLLEVLSDPQKLKEMLRIANMSANSPYATSVLGSLGLLEATE